MPRQKTEKKFKIGDLVINMFPLHLDIYDCVIKEGEIGLIIAIPEDDDIVNNFGAYDYTVLIRGIEVAYFETELSKHTKDKKKWTLHTLSKAKH